MNMKNNLKMTVIHIEKDFGNEIQEIILLKILDSNNQIQIIKKIIEVKYPSKIKDLKEF